MGHILPIVPVLKMLKENNPHLKAYFIGTTKGLEKNYIENSGLFLKAYYFDSQGFKRKLSFHNIITLYKYFKNYFHSRRLLRKIQPDIVVGMGGYVSGAVVKAALALRIKTAIHEQNSVYGFTNKVLRKKVDKVLLSYDIERNDKTILVGNPRISDIYYRYKDKIKPVNEKTVLVVGGSRGAGTINDLIISMKKQFIDNGIKVILITGSKYYKENISNISVVRDNDFIVKSFVGNLPELMLKARVVVTRCGATTISEVQALKKVCLFIPSPNVTANHQVKNAAEMVNRGAAMMIKEQDLNRKKLFEAIDQLMHNKELRSKIINNLNLITDVASCYKFVDQLNGLINK